MNINIENQFTFSRVSDEFVLFCRAEMPECGNIFSLSAPRIDHGVLLSVKPDGSIAYTVNGISELTFTVTCYPAASVRTGVISRGSSVFRRMLPVRRVLPLPFRKSTFLRL